MLDVLFGKHGQFIFGAWISATIIVVGLLVWQLWDRRQLQRRLNAVDPNTKQDGSGRPVEGSDQ